MGYSIILGPPIVSLSFASVASNPSLRGFGRTSRYTAIVNGIMRKMQLSHRSVLAVRL